MAGLLALVAIAVMVCSVALLGLPGAAWLTLASPLARLLTSQRAPPDAMWPMALIHSLVWPMCLPLAYLVVARQTEPGRWRIGWTLLLTAAAAMSLAVAFQVRSGSVS